MTHLKNNSLHLINDLLNHFPGNWGSNNQQNYPTASVNIYETENAFLLHLNAPGRNKENFSLNVEKGLLTISYEAKAITEETNQKTVRREFSYRSFKRSFSVDEKIDTDQIQAKYENGVLIIQLPKKETLQSMPTQIAIQ